MIEQPKSEEDKPLEKTKLKPIYKNGQIIGYATNEANVDYKSKLAMNRFWTIVNFIIKSLTRN